MIRPTYKVDNDKRFAQALDRARAAMSDLTIPLTLISKDFYRSERAIFQLKSPGQYEDLKPSTKIDKQRRGFSIYPILKRTGRLEKSLTSPADSEAVNQIANKRTLVIGTQVPYAGFLQDGTRNMPARPHLFIGPEAPRFAVSETAGRPERWLNILNEFVLKKMALIARPA